MESMELDNSTMEYGYRTSVIQNQSFVVTKVTFRLQPGDPEQIAAKMEELAIRRREKQPLEYPSAGSTFKRRGIFRRAADHGSRSAGILRRRRKGIGKALRIYYQHRQCHCRRCKRCDLGSTEKSERTFSRGAGTRDRNSCNYSEPCKFVFCGCLHLRRIANLYGEITPHEQRTGRPVLQGSLEEVILRMGF